MIKANLFSVLLLIGVLPLVPAFANPEESTILASPVGLSHSLETGPVCFHLGISKDGQLSSNTKFQGKPAALDSPLGLTVDGVDIGQKIQSIKEQHKGSGEATYAITTQGGQNYFLDVRTYPDGLAIRYRIPSDTPRTIEREQTSFSFPSSTRAWYASGPFQYGWIQSYQDRLTDTIQGELLAPPATFRLPSGTYAAVTEANLTHFHGAVMFGDAPNRIRFGFVDNKGHIESGIPTGMPAMQYAHSEVRDIAWKAFPDASRSEIITPWRILMLASDLNGLVNNNIIREVSNPPDHELFPQGSKTSWIKPGRAVFTWLTQGGASRLSQETYKKYIDGASELGLESVVIDDGWEHWPDKWKDIAELAEYGKKRHVGIWLWRPSSPRFGNRNDIGLEQAEERTAFMKKCAELGVQGLKIDFFHTENAYTVQLMEDILKEAARNKLMVVFHGVNKPTGDYFTYPNLLAKEAVRGLECVGGENNWAPGPPWPYHNTVLPFTRWLAGGADYTPLNFRHSYPPSVTFAHQFATIYVLTSQMLILAADMEDMLSSPGRGFIESVPVVWDETVVLPESSIGELAAIARRKGNTWYLGVLNGEKPRELKSRLEFLSAGIYDLEILVDSPNDRKNIQIRRSTFRTGDSLTEDLHSGGGLVIRITRRP